MKRTLSLLLALLLLWSLAACGGGESAPAETPAAETAVPEAAETPTPAPDFADWLAQCGGEPALFGAGAPAEALGGAGDCYLDTEAGECWLKAEDGWDDCGAYRDAGCCLLRLEDGDATRLLVTEAGALLPEPAPESTERHFEGWFAGDYGGAFDFAGTPLTEDLTLRALYTDEAPRAEPLLTLSSLRDEYFQPTGTNAVLVIYYGCPDGPELDRAAFEELFCGEYGREDELRSAASYFRCNSCGKVELEFHFCYLDSGLSSAELYQRMQTAMDRYEAYDYYRSIFRQAMAGYEGDPRELDRDGDGYVDAVVLLSGEDVRKTVGDGQAYYVFGGGSMGDMQDRPNWENPSLRLFVDISAALLSEPLEPCAQGTGARVLIHELGHVFGLMDYYDFYPYGGDYAIIDALGAFDMQSHDTGDWNPYSRFCCGWVEPWLIEEGTEQITLAVTPDQPLLIPSSLGWNGTPFDEYILVDVLAPIGANGYDWDWLLEPRLVPNATPKSRGGVRVYHVDSRMVSQNFANAGTVYDPAFTYEEMLDALNDPHSTLLTAYYNTNGVEPLLEGDSRFYHMIDWIPADGSSKFRLCTPLSWAIYTPGCVNDLFGPGEEFSMERCADAFPNAPRMNNGGTLDYSIRVEHYDPEAATAIVTVKRVR